MFTIKSPLKYFPISVGDYTLKYSEKANEFSLFEKNHGWMGYDQNSFWQSSEFYIEIDQAYGTCITTGLGLGILQSHLCLKKDVTKVIVYEKSKDVIEIFHEIIKYNNFDISKLEIRQDNADLIEQKNCDCLFPDHFDSETEEDIISVVRNLSQKNRASLVWYWPAGNHFIKYANNKNKPLDNSTYESWKEYTGIVNMPRTFSDDIFSYFAHLQTLYIEDVKGSLLNSQVKMSIMRKNMLNHSKKLKEDL